jgi:urease accessory protein
MTKKIILSATLLMAMTGLAQAHPNHSVFGVAQGFLHPITGWDHIVAMVAVGFFAANLGGRALWAVPLSFVSMMAFGGALGMAALPLPFVEMGIFLSVVVLAGAAVLRLQASLPVAIALCGFFAVFHGFAHGAEMPENVSSLNYALGFIASTALLHVFGISLGLLLAKPKLLKQA